MAIQFTCLLCRSIFMAIILCVQTMDKGLSQRTSTLKNILEGYNSELPPDYDSGTPVQVSVQLVVLSIDSINEQQMDYSMTLYLRQTWVDDRLKYTPFNVTHSNNTKEVVKNKEGIITEKPHPASPSQGEKMLNNVSEGKLELGTQSMNKVWVPDTFFYNERDASFHDVTVPNKLLHIYANGTVYFSTRVSLTLTCNMDLSKYPFDRQTCPLTLGSYGYSDEILEYHWINEEALVTNKKMELPTFTITHWDVENCDDEIDSYGCLTLKVSLARSFGFYIAQVYVPSILVVILSWVSFWLDIDAIPARISLGLLTVLTMTTMGVGARSSLPRISYLKALDVWNAVCLLFVFSALLEFAYVNVTTRVENRRLSMRDAVSMATGKDTGKLTITPKVKVHNRQRARLTDKIARVAFPTSFITFNIFYWCYYMI